MTDAPPHNARYERGWRTLTALNGGDRARVVEGLADLAPDLGRMIVEFGYGDVYARPGLAPRERQLTTIGALVTAGGCEPQLEVHLHVALNVGLTAREIVEAVMHCVPFCGFPRVLNAMAVVRTVFERRGVEIPLPEA